MSSEVERIASLETRADEIDKRCCEEKILREKIFDTLSNLRSQIDKAKGAVFVLCGGASILGAVIGQVLAKHFGG